MQDGRAIEFAAGTGRERRRELASHQRSEHGLRFAHGDLAARWNGAGRRRLWQRRRYYHTATLLRDGSVLVVAGFNNAVGTLDSCERYRMDNGNWKRMSTGRLTQPRYGHTATLLNDV